MYVAIYSLKWQLLLYSSQSSITALLNKLAVNVALVKEQNTNPITELYRLQNVNTIN